MFRKIFLISFLQTLLLSAVLLAQDKPVCYSISFKEAENLAIENSHQIASQSYMAKAAMEQAKAQKVWRYPSIDFEADSMFQSKIGSIQIPSIGNKDVGDHTNWSVGPAVNWIVWDTGQITKKAKSLEKRADAHMANLDYVTRQVLLNVRLSYIGVQLAKEHMRLVSDALKLAHAQYADILEKKKAGTADQFDLTVAHQEVVDREMELESAKGELAIAKRILVAALGFYPESPDINSIDVESIEVVLRTLLPKSNTNINIESHPQVKALADEEQSAKFAAESSKARRWPKITMHGKSSFEYPNLGDKNTIQQNKLMLGLRMPIFDWGLINKESLSYKYQANFAKEQRQQTIIDLSRSAAEIRERIETLKKLRTKNARAVQDAVLIAKLSYDSYKAGKIIFLDVQKANMKALTAKIDSAKTDAELAMQISKLLAIAESEEPAQ